MGWQDLLAEDEDRVLPWVGGRTLYWAGRTWTVRGPLPPEFGWYCFRVNGGRNTELTDQTPAPPQPEPPGAKVLRGYLVGDRLVPDNARVDPDPGRILEQTQAVALVELGLDRFTRATVLRTPAGLLYLRQEFPQGPEAEVEMAYQDRRPTTAGIAGVTPALDLAFRWLTAQRERAEARERERQVRAAAEEQRRQEHERLAEARKNAGTGAGRRALAARDFTAAARAALALSGAELLDARPSYNRGEMVVQYRFRHRRLECVVHAETMQITDAGICLTDHHTGEKGDTRFTLESLPTVVGEALDRGLLHVWRHVDGDRNYDEDEW